MSNQSYHVWRRIEEDDFIAMAPRQRCRAMVDGALWWFGICFAVEKTLILSLQAVLP